MLQMLVCLSGWSRPPSDTGLAPVVRVLLSQHVSQAGQRAVIAKHGASVYLGQITARSCTHQASAALEAPNIVAHCSACVAHEPNLNFLAVWETREVKFNLYLWHVMHVRHAGL